MSSFAFLAFWSFHSDTVCLYCQSYSQWISPFSAIRAFGTLERWRHEWKVAWPSSEVVQISVREGFQIWQLSAVLCVHRHKTRGGGGHLPNFCTRVCQRGLQNHTLSLAIFLKKRHPFSCNFLVKNNAIFPANSAKMYPFINKISEKCRVAPKIPENCRRVIHFLLKTTPFLLHFDEKKHTISLARFWWKTHPTWDVGTPTVPCI